MLGMSLLDFLRKKTDTKPEPEVSDEGREQEAKTPVHRTDWPQMPPINGIRIQNVEIKAPELPEAAVIDDIRRDEIGSLVFEEVLNTDTLRFLSLQEVLFVLTAQETLGARGETLPRFEENHRKLYNEVLSRIRSAETIFCLFDTATGYPFLEGDSACIYLDKNIAVYAAYLYACQNRRLQVRECPGEAFVSEGDSHDSFFDLLYYLGISYLIIDNGCYHMRFAKQAMVADPGDWTANKNPMPVNGRLVCNMLRFLQELKWQVGYEQRSEVLKERENAMLTDMSRARFIIPTRHEGPAEVMEGGLIKIEGDTRLQFPIMEGSGGEAFLPVFTDIIEFSKRFRGSEWLGGVFEFHSIKGVLADKSGMIINPDGQRLVVTKDRLEDL